MVDEQAAIGISRRHGAVAIIGRLELLRLAVAVVIICAAGSVAVALGTDNNWDLLYYHLYAPYAYLHDRYLYDIGPAQFQGYFNPVADLLFYGLVSSALNDTPRVISFVMGAVHGINAVLVAAIAWHVLRPPQTTQRIILVAAAVLIGISGAGFVSLLGTTTNDLFNSIFVLGALLALLRTAVQSDRQPLWRGFATAGMLAGAGVGLKYTAACFIPGLLLVALIVCLQRRSIAAPLAFGIAAAAAFVAIAGHHMLVLWSHFGNPFFPNLNEIFRSPYYEPYSIRDARFVAHDVWQLIGYPFYWAKTNKYVVAELSFGDWRGAVAYTVTVVALLSLLLRFFRRASGVPCATRGLGLVIVFAAISLLCWGIGFGIYRYVVTLEMLTGVLTVGALTWIFAGGRLRIATALAALALVGATTVYLDWGRGEYGDKYVDIRVPPLPPRSIVLIATQQPVSFFIPFADPGTQFIGIENNYLTLSQTNLLATEVKRLTREPNRPKFVLNFGAFDGAKLNAVLDRLGTRLAAAPCLPIEQNLAEEDEEALSLCPVAD
jgi:hypothetical protein